MRTRWTPTFGGPPSGLDYASAYPLIDRITTSEDDWWALFNDLQVLEAAALAQMQEDHQPG